MDGKGPAGHPSMRQSHFFESSEKFMEPDILARTVFPEQEAKAKTDAAKEARAKADAAPRSVNSSVKSMPPRTEPVGAPEIVKGSVCTYRNADCVDVPVVVKSIHYDDQDPYYTIDVDGVERSTTLDRLIGVSVAPLTDESESEAESESESAQIEAERLEAEKDAANKDAEAATAEKEAAAESDRENEVEGSGLAVPSTGFDMLPGDGQTANNSTYVFFSDTSQKTMHYNCCSAYGNAVAEMTSEGFNHDTTLIFGGDMMDVSKRNDFDWAQWMKSSQLSTAAGMDSTTEAIRDSGSGHVVCLGQRDASKVRLMPWVEVPPPFPPDVMYGGDASVMYKNARSRVLDTLREPSIVASTSWTMYNFVIGRVFDNVQSGMVSFPDVSLVEKINASRDNGERGDEEDAFLNVLIFCKLVFMVNATMVSRTDIESTRDYNSGLIGGLIELHSSDLSQDARVFMNEAVERLVIRPPRQSEEQIVLSQGLGGEELDKWRTEFSIDRVQVTFRDLVNSAMTIEKQDQTVQLIKAMKIVVQAVQNWVSPGGAMYKLLTDIGHLVFVDEGRNPSSTEKWRIGCTHAGTHSDKTSPNDSIFENECLYKLPSNYQTVKVGDIEEGHIEWTSIAKYFENETDAVRNHGCSLQRWSIIISSLYHALVRHVYTQYARSDEGKGITYDVVRNDVHTHGPTAKRGTHLLHLDFNMVMGIVGRLSVAMDSEASGPVNGNQFDIPGNRIGNRGKLDPLEADYHDTPMVWLQGHYDNPTADRIISSKSAIGFNKQAVRVDTHFFQPSFAIAAVTDCSAWHDQFEIAMAHRWSQFSGGDFDSRSDLPTHMATASGHDMEDWHQTDPIVVGPLVMHIGGLDEKTGQHKLSRARMLIWRFNHLEPQRAMYVFVNPKELNNIEAEDETEMPLANVYMGLVAVPMPSNTAGMGTNGYLRGGAADMGTSSETDRLVQQKLKKKEAPIQSSDDRVHSVMNLSPFMWSQVIPAEEPSNSSTGLLAYCTSSRDLHFGMRLTVKKDREGAWGFVKI